jgi:hypothetical protein
MKTYIWFEEARPYPVRSFTYRTEQVRANEVQKGDRVQKDMSNKEHI